MSPHRALWRLLRDASVDFIEDDCPRMAAALAYYTIFSLPPLTILALNIAAAVWDADAMREALAGQLGDLIGPRPARGVQTILENVERTGGDGPVSALVGIGALIFGATGAFIQLQSSLNRAWEVEPDPAQGGIRNFVLKRFFSFGMVLATGFLLLVSLLLTATLSAFGEALMQRLPGRTSDAAMWVFDLTLSLTLASVLFAAIFKVLPDARVAWRDVWVGAFATAVLFVAGKFALGMYLGRSDPGEAFGAAGSLAVLLLWIYYSGLILLFGAEFTQSWAESHGAGIHPERGAVRVVEEKRRVPPRPAAEPGVVGPRPPP